jgi:hypothetical protein
MSSRPVMKQRSGKIIGIASRRIYFDALTRSNRGQAIPNGSVIGYRTGVTF